MKSTTEYDFTALEDAFQAWAFHHWPFSYTNLLLDGDWDNPPTPEQFDEFVSGIADRSRCAHCGRVYEGMTAEYGRGTVCAGCGREN